MKTMMKLLKLAVIGLGVGNLCTLACMWALADAGDMVTMEQVLTAFSAWAAASALLGLCGMLFEINALNKLAAIVLHMLLCMTIALVTCLYLGYIASPMEFLIHIAPLFLIIYVVLAAAFFVYDKEKVRQLNEKLKNR